MAVVLTAHPSPPFHTALSGLPASSKLAIPRDSQECTEFRESASKRKRPADPFVGCRGDLTPGWSACRELSRAAGAGPFYPPCHTAGRRLGADPKSANRWLLFLEDAGILQTAEKGSNRTQRATRHRYLPPHQPVQCSQTELTRRSTPPRDCPMSEVRLSEDAAAQLEELPLPIQVRICCSSWNASPPSAGLAARRTGNCSADRQNV